MQNRAGLISGQASSNLVARRRHLDELDHATRHDLLVHRVLYGVPEHGVNHLHGPSQHRLPIRPPLLTAGIDQEPNILRRKPIQ